MDLLNEPEAVAAEAKRLMTSQAELKARFPYLWPTEAEHRACMDELRPAYKDYTERISEVGHAASLETSAYLLWLCRKLDARRVIDLGSGFSSHVLNKWAAEADHEVVAVSVDHDRVWMAKSEQFTPAGTYVEWDEFRADIVEPFDIVFHDLAGGELRTRSAGFACSLVAPGGVIVFDDAHHDGHRSAAWEQSARHDLSPHSTHLLTMDGLKRFAMIGVSDRRQGSVLADLYAEKCATPSDIYEHLPTFVRLVDEMDARHVVELGTRTGVSTIAWLYALERTGGRLTSVDLDAKPPIGDWPHWTFIQGDDEDPDVIDQLDPCDILFLDTSHHYAHTLRELHTYRWLVKPGGLIVCHDTELPIPEGAPAGDPLYPVKKAIELFCRDTGLEWTNDPRCWGLGIIKVV